MIQRKTRVAEGPRPAASGTRTSRGDAAALRPPHRREEAHCPNVGRCWGEGTATVMILGDTCTRGCRFCAVTTGNPAWRLRPPSPSTPPAPSPRWASTTWFITMVDRDDLDGGAPTSLRPSGRQARRPRSSSRFVGDFQGALRDVRDRRARRGARRVRPQRRDGGAAPALGARRRCRLERSLRRPRPAKKVAPARYTKSSIMIGLGETDEVTETVRALRDAVPIDVLTLGQYLRPSPKHLAVERFVTPERFRAWREEGSRWASKYVASGSLVRSSYRPPRPSSRALRAVLPRAPSGPTAACRWCPEGESMAFVLDDVVRVLGSGPRARRLPCRPARAAMFAQMRAAARRLDARLTELRDQGRLAEHASTGGRGGSPVRRGGGARRRRRLFPTGARRGGGSARRPLARWMAHAGHFARPAHAARRHFSRTHLAGGERQPAAGGSQLVQAAGVAWAAKTRGALRPSSRCSTRTSVETRRVFTTGSTSPACTARRWCSSPARARGRRAARVRLWVRPARVDGATFAAVFVTAGRPRALRPAGRRPTSSRPTSPPAKTRSSVPRRTSTRSASPTTRAWLTPTTPRSPPRSRGRGRQVCRA